MGLNSYVEKKRALQTAEQQKESAREARESWSKHTFSQKKDQITNLIKKAFASSNFDLQEDSSEASLNFYSYQIDEKAKITFRIHETIEAEVELNDTAIGSIHISDAEGDGYFIFDPIGSNLASLGEENSFEFALDKLIDKHAEFMFIQD